MGLVTLERVKLEIGIAEDDDSKDAWLEAKIAEASTTLASERFCNHPLEYRSDFQWEFTAPQPIGSKLLPFDPIWEIMAVEYRDSASADWTEIAEDSYELQRDGSLNLLWILGGLAGGRTYRVTMSVGYADPEGVPPDGISVAPDDLQAVVLDMIAWAHDQRFDHRRGLKSKGGNQDGTTRSYVTKEEKEKEWIRSSSPYRRLMTA